MTELQQIAKNWLESDRTDTATGVAICRNIPEASVFVDYAICFTVERQTTEIVKFLTRIAGAVSAHEESPSVVETKQSTIVANETIRPSHFDTWFDRMSPTLQTKVNELQNLHTKKKYYREIVERLADDPNHSKQDMSLAATAVVAFENKIQAIYDQADIEWEELNDRSVMDDVKKKVHDAETKADKDIQAIPSDHESEDADDNPALNSETPTTSA